MAELYIQGMKAGSQNEYNVSIALKIMRLSYEYQYIIGMFGTRGSQIIDFLVYTVPKPTPLFVHGEYWHKGKKAIEDQLKLSEIASTMHNLWFEPVIIWGEQCETVEDAVNNLRTLLNG